MDAALRQTSIRGFWNRIHGQDYRPYLLQFNQNGLVAGHMPAGFNQFDSGQQFSIAIDQAVVQSRMVPMLPLDFEAGFDSLPRNFILGPLHDKLRRSKQIVRAAVITEVEGSAHLTGRHSFVLEDDDELGTGFLLR